MDCFCGSGSTGVACLETGRKFYGCEIDKKYYDIAVERIQNIEQTSLILHISKSTNLEYWYGHYEPQTLNNFKKQGF